MKFRFKPTDFSGVLDCKEGTKAAWTANAILEEHEKTLKTVFGVNSSDWWCECPNNTSVCTHKALLWGLKEVEK